MRIDVKKFIFIGLAEDKAAFFKKAQELGAIDFIDVGKGKEQSAEVTNIAAAIKVLRGLPTTKQEELSEYALADGLVHKILKYKHAIERLLEEQRVVNLEISRIEIFGDFALNDLQFIEREGKRKIQFYFGKHGAAADVPLPPEVLYVASEHGLDYFVAINSEPQQYPKLVEMKIELPLGELKKRKENIAKEIHDTEQILKTYAKYNTFLHHALVYKLNAYNLQIAQNDVETTMDNQLFAVSGWIPVNKVSALSTLLAKMHVHTEEVAIEPTDVIPTYLENKGIHRMGEDLVHIYDTPSPTDNDPSLWVLLSFALFFSFIVGDGGYGLIFLGVALYLRYKYSDITGTKRRVLNLFTMLCFACIAWGLVTSSFFGISISPENPLRKYSALEWLVEKKAAYHISHQDATYDHWVKEFPNLKDVKDPHTFVTQAKSGEGNSASYDLLNKFTDNIMLELALFIGVIHVISSMFRYLPRNWTMLGWIMFIIGGYLYFPDYLEATSMTQYVFGIDMESAAKNGLYLIFGGIAVAVIIAIVKHKLLGVLEIMTAIQVFADILSYLRLYALGLAGALVSATINESAALMPFVFGALLVFVGHAINILLAVMSGIIHGLRLNFLEWYHYSFEGGGKKFKPLQKLKVE